MVGVDEAIHGMPAPPGDIGQREVDSGMIFSAVMPGGSAGSEKSTVAGSRPINSTRFIYPPPEPQLSCPGGVERELRPLRGH